MGEYPLEAEPWAGTAEDEGEASEEVTAGSSVPPARDAGQKSRTARRADGGIANHMVGDRPAGSAKEDRPGFGPYVAAVAGFLTDSSTRVPLTLSVEGWWGPGKSSFMRSLQAALVELGRKKIVSFNAWQYSADEGLWAAFIHDFDATMHDNLDLGERVRVRWRLLKLRLSWQDTVETIKTVVWLVASLFMLAALMHYLWQHGLHGFQEHLADGKKVEEATTSTLGLVGGVGGTAAALMLFLTQLRELIKSPASLDKTSKMLTRQRYDSQLPLVHKISHEFSDLLTAYAEGEPVYIFIDNLDRCEYSRAADVIQALLILTSDAPNMVLILGLDRRHVAAALAAKQEALLPYLYNLEKSELHGVGMDYGQGVLERFIHLTYILPQPRADGLWAMMRPEASTGFEQAPLSQRSEEAIRIVRGEDDSGTLDRIAEMASRVFGHKFWNVKQFINTFRLQVFIANETGLFGSSRVMRDSGKALSITQLAKYVALCMRWPELVATVSAEDEIVGRLEEFFLYQRVEGALREDERRWRADTKLGELLLFGLPDEEFSLTKVDFAALSAISPIRAASGEDEGEGAMPESAPAPRTMTPNRTQYAERQRVSRFEVRKR